MNWKTIDFATGREEALVIARNLKQNHEYGETVLVGLMNLEDNAFDRTSFNDMFRKPFDASVLASSIRMLVERRKQLA